MSQKNNVIIQNIKDLENLIQTGLVKPDDYINDLNTLRRIQDNINQDNIKQCRLLSKQLKGFSSEALKQIDEYIEQLIYQNQPSKTDKTVNFDVNNNEQPKDSNFNQGEAIADENQAINNEEERKPAPVPTQPTAHITQNQFELGIALGILQKETNSLKEYLNNILARQRDTDASINNQFDQFRNVQNNMEILSETIKNLEPLLVKIMPDIKEASKDIKEQLTELLNNSNLIKRVTEHQTEVDSMLKKIRDSLNSDMDDLYKKMRMSAAGVVDEVVENSKKSIVESGVEIVQTATFKTDKKYTNLMIFGLLGFFICSGLTSAFTAKLVATYSSNNTIEYITKLLNDAADKNKEQQQVKKSKK